jgi:hypothetical protein
MKFYYYILLFFLIAIAGRIYYLFFRRYTKPKPVKNQVEGFGGFGFESIDNCLDQGYPNDFCMRVPLEACLTNCPLGTFLPKKFNTF